MDLADQLGGERLALRDPLEHSANRLALRGAEAAKSPEAAKRARYVRFRIRSADPVARLTIRSLEIFVAVSGGVRLSKVA